MTNLGAHTGLDAYYPPYVSVSEHSGLVVISVRGAPRGQTIGPEAEITMTRSDFEHLLCEINERLSAA